MGATDQQIRSAKVAGSIEFAADDANLRHLKREVPSVRDGSNYCRSPCQTKGIAFGHQP
jgi:hypothetical protein